MTSFEQRLEELRANMQRLLDVTNEAPPPAEAASQAKSDTPEHATLSPAQDDQISIKLSNDLLRRQDDEG